MSRIPYGLSAIFESMACTKEEKTNQDAIIEAVTNTDHDALDIVFGNEEIILSDEEIEQILELIPVDESVEIGVAKLDGVLEAMINDEQ